MSADGVALFDACVEADSGACGWGEGGEGSGCGEESASGVFAVDAEFDAVSAGACGDVFLGVGEFFAFGDAEHFAYEVDAGDFFGDGVFDLESGVDFEEGDGSVLADEVFACACTDVASFVEDGFAGSDEFCVLFVGEEGCWGFFDEFLVASLE